MLRAASPNHEFSNAGWVRVSVRVLWGEPFVIVLVSIDDEIDLKLGENLPEWTDS